MSLSFASAEGPKTCFAFVGPQGTSLSLIPNSATNCENLNSTLHSCSAVPVSMKNSCLCKQAVFDDIYGCENDFKLCYGTNMDLSGIEAVLAAWHEGCDDFIDFSPTIPAGVSLTSTYDIPAAGVCQSVLSVCQFWVSSASRCAADFPLATETDRLSSCQCQVPLISAASVCLYDENKTCIGRPAALSNIGLWQSCPDQASVFLAAQPATISADITGASIPPLPTSTGHGPHSRQMSRTATATNSHVESGVTPPKCLNASRWAMCVSYSVMNLLIGSFILNAIS